MNRLDRKAKTLISALVIFFSLYFALVGGLLFWDMPPKSDDFDCDDAVRFVYDRLSRFGQEQRLTIMLGNLERAEEDYPYEESDHVWLLAKIGPFEIPIDWKEIRFGSKYYQGWEIDYDKLIFFVEQDFETKGLPANEND